MDVGNVCAGFTQVEFFLIKIPSFLFLRMGTVCVTTVSGEQNPKGKGGKINLLFLKLNSPKCS
jgi:hypothetical protein